jgi:hypothetical protein
MYAPILLEERGEKGEPLLCFMPKEPSLAWLPAQGSSNHMGAQIHVLWWICHLEAQHFSQPQYTNKGIRPIQAKQNVSNGEKGRLGGSSLKNQILLISIETNIS